MANYVVCGLLPPSCDHSGGNIFVARLKTMNFKRALIPPNGNEFKVE